MGPTASGKSDLAEAVAERLDAVLLNADAFQIYRGMDIGTAKPIDRSRYRLLDIRDPDEAFGLGEWIQLAASELRTAWGEGRSVIIVGGTGLYIRALFEGYDSMCGPPTPGIREAYLDRLQSEGLPSLVAELRERAADVAERVDCMNPQRVIRALEKLRGDSQTISVEIPPFMRQKFAIEREPEALRAKISARTQAMLQSGWREEVQVLLKKGFKPSDPGFRAHGYRAIAAHLGGEMEYDSVLERTVVEVRQYAKRQRTWLRREPNLSWLPDENGDALLRRVLDRVEDGDDELR